MLLISFTYLKTKDIANLPYNKFRTNCLRFNQNHLYKKMYLIYNRGNIIITLSFYYQNNIIKYRYRF
jgi:hypothetical protein